MEKSVSLTYFPPSKNYRKIAQIHWGLTDEQMEGLHVHHEPPVCEGGRNIPEHLYVCSPSIHRWGWHDGKEWIEYASRGGKKGGKVSGPKSFKGRHHTEETKEKLRRINTGKKQSRETIEKRVSKTRGQTRSQEFKDAMSVKMKGNTYGKHCVHTEEHKAHLSEKMKGNKFNQGKKRSEETRQKIAEALRRSWANRRNT